MNSMLKMRLKACWWGFTHPFATSEQRIINADRLAREEWDESYLQRGYQDSLRSE